ncbi:hypothetical protein BGX33_008355 [Mortierella sp. NVP41]|nr:hypothetical protein BGX33_008355 [Mortierella sp. NVP41]
MFYSKEILARKDTQLGLIWLAATIGSRSGINKLSKKEVNGVNIVKSCKDISQPVEPFALRFSSNLMMGVTRVYSQQCNFYYTDVSNTWMRLKRDLAAVQSENLDMMHPDAKIDAITFGYDLAIEEDLFRPFNVVQNYEIEVARNSRNKKVAVEFGWAPQSSLDLSDTLSDDPSPPPMFLLLRSDERRRKITLDERQGMPGSSQGMDFEGLNAGLTDDVLMGDDVGFYIDAEGNLRADMPEKGFANMDEGSVVPGLSESPTTERTLGKHPRTEVEARTAEQFVPENYDLLDDFLFDGRDQNMQAGAEMEGTAQVKRSKTGTKQHKPVGLVFDERTVLSDDELRAFRDNFLRDQADIIREREAKQELSSAKARIDTLLGQPLGIAGFGQDLSAFWNIAGAHTLAVDTPERRGGNLFTEQARNAPLISARGAHDASLFGAGQDDMLFMNEDVPELETGRHLVNPPSAGTPAGMSTGGFGLDSVGSGDRHGGQLPWDQGFRSSAGGRSENLTDSDHHWQDFDSAFDQAAGDLFQRRRRTGSVDSRSSAESGALRARPFGGLNGEEEDEPLVRRRRHQSLLKRSSRTPSQDSIQAGSSSLFRDIDDGLAGDGGGGGGGVGGTQERVALEKATANFLGYIQSLLKPTNATSFSFEEVISPHRRRDVAAAAFYHVLALSTMGLMRPKQDVPYEDIQVNLLG